MTSRRPVRKQQVPPKKEAKKEPKTLKGACQEILESMEDRAPVRIDPAIAEAEAKAAEELMEMMYGPRWRDRE